MPSRQRPHNRLYTLFGAAFTLLLTSPVFALAAGAIESFEADISIYADGSFTVTEEITYDFGTEERHGIFRTLPLDHPQPGTAWYKDRELDLDIIAVGQDGTPAIFATTTTSEGLQIRIGDPDRTIDGIHEYTIMYRVAGGLFYYESGAAELYWNVTGNDWTVPIGEVTATVRNTGDLFGRAYDCYQGAPGAVERCTATSTETQTVFRATDLAPGEGLTIGQALDPEAVAVMVAEEAQLWFFFLPVYALYLIGFAVWLYRHQTAHRPNRPIVTQFEPYEGVLPMFTGVLADGSLDSRDITAGILYLAEQGFLRIKKTARKVLFLFETNDYELTLEKNVNEAPTNFHKTILELLFKNGEAGEVVLLSSLKGDASKQRENQKHLSALRSAIAKDLVERGFYEKYPAANYLKLLGLIAIPGILALLIGVLVPLVLISCVLAFVIGTLIIHRRRTRKGYEAYQHLLGFKEFLSVTGKDRFAFHNAPEKNPETFLEYLPYAVAFGVEKKWAKVFEDVTIPTPSWYDSGSPQAAFSAGALTSDLGSFSSSFSSSSGSSSGSSGGGASGGGAGGGGGGAW